MKFAVAIDGPAAAGKGTIAKAIAANFGLGHLDTGLLYRAVAARVLEGEKPAQAAHALIEADLVRDGLRSGETGSMASQVAALPDVRAALVDFQRAYAARAGGAVLDGRDIGTVICPDADVKFFVTASDEVRAERRLKELLALGEDTDLWRVLADLRRRDERDRGRDVAPLAAAKDAVLIDTSNLSIDQAVLQAVEIVSKKIDGLAKRES